MGWAKENLPAADRRSIAEGLIVQGGGKVTQHDAGRGELIALCPLHQESNPSFSYNYAKDVYNCSSGCGAGDLVKLYAEVNGLSNKAGFKQFKAKYGPQDGAGRDRGSKGRNGPGQGQNKAPDDPPEIIPEEVWEALPELPELWVARLIKERAWTRDAITRLDLRLWTAPEGEARKAAQELKPRPYLGRKGERRIAIPVRDDEGRLVNIRLYLPGAEANKVVSWGRGYGSTRLWPGEGTSAVEDAPVLWLCEGEPDVICAISQGLEAVTQTAGAGTWKPEHSARFAGRHVVIAYDADGPGWKGALKVAQAIARRAASVRVIRWPDFMLPDTAEGDYSDRLPEKHGQDLTDFFARHHQSVDDLMDLLADAYEIKAPHPAPRADGLPAEPGLERWRAWSGLDLKVSFRPLLMVREIMGERQICTERESGLSYIYNQDQGVWEAAPIEIIKRLVIAKMGIAASRNRIGEAAELIQTLSVLDEGMEMDHDPYAVNVANGMVDLRTWEILPHAPEWRSTHQHPWAFDPAKPVPCPYWIAGLFKTIQIPEVISEAQEFAGYCQLRDYPFHKTLWLIGGGNDGKSKFLEILRELVGRKRCAAINLRDLEDQFLRVMMHKAMLNVFTEASADFFRNEHLKALTGGDDVTAAHKHQKPFTFKSTCKHAFSMNALPRMADKTHGLYRRILPIKFRHRFEAEDSDPYIVDKWRSELPGIFQWSLVGLRRLLDRGDFSESATTKAVLAEYKDANNVLRLFIDERCDKGEHFSVSKQDLFDSFNAWQEDAKISKRMDKPRFFRELKSMDDLRINERRLTTGNGRERVIDGLSLSTA